MKTVEVDFKGIETFITKEEIDSFKDKMLEAHNKLENKNGLGNNMLGWLDLADRITDEEVDRIKKIAEDIGRKSEVVVVVGTGGSYLGAKAVIDLFTDTFNSKKSNEEREYPEVIFAGNNLSAKYLRDLIGYLKDKDFCINVISKSGKTLEPMVAFRMLKILLEDKYGENVAKQRIYVTTDKLRGTLKQMASHHNYETFVVPDDVGGRYSVLSSVGLLPIAIAGVDIRDLLDGAIFARFVFNNKDIDKNDCYKYAVCRNILYQKNKDIEVMTTYEPSFCMFLEWYKQLFAESEGKDGKGIFPTSLTCTMDLHSIGQLIQSGKRNIFETVINIDKNKEFIYFPKAEIDEDGLNYIADMAIDDINKAALEGTKKAHIEGGIPNIQINIDEVNPYNIGGLIYFFEKACAISAYMLGVNPFNQPGVEDYKKNMMDILRRGK